MKKKTNIENNAKFRIYNFKDKPKLFFSYKKYRKIKKINILQRPTKFSELFYLNG
jgi:hypothetical protein